MKHHLFSLNLQRPGIWAWPSCGFCIRIFQGLIKVLTGALTTSNRPPPPGRLHFRAHSCACWQDAVPGGLWSYRPQSSPRGLQVTWQLTAHSQQGRQQATDGSKMEVTILHPNHRSDSTSILPYLFIIRKSLCPATHKGRGLYKGENTRSHSQKLFNTEQNQCLVSLIH